MSDIPASQSTMIPPGTSQSYPELHYDDAGNAYARNNYGAWEPHPGVCQTITSQSFRMEHMGPQPCLTYRPTGTYTLSTPAEFNSGEGTPPPMPSGSRLPLRRAGNEVIDPVLIPLPDTSDKDLIHPSAIADACGYIPAAKTAGSRRKVKAATDKGKGKENLGYVNPRKRSREDATADDDDTMRTRRGRPNGSNNYSSLDKKILLNMVEEELPLGQRGWQAIYLKFSQWAKANGRPERKVTSLETKFKQLVKTTKPTGNGVCPPEVKRAHQIDGLINERAGTRDLNDTDFDANDDDSWTVMSDHDDPDNTSPPVQHTAVARSTPRTEAPAPRRNARGVATDLLTRLSGAFDPAAQRTRDEDRANRSLATTQLLTQSQQLRDSQAVVESLRTQLFDLRTRLYDVERERDKAELRIEMMQMSGSTRRQHVPMPKRKSLHQDWYPEGGGCTRWITDEGSESSHSEGFGLGMGRKIQHKIQRKIVRPRKYADSAFFASLPDATAVERDSEQSVEV
ncbi:hypothetical protein M405DRAFT_881852 [Rhizopogon salebrosus TDB-379]|nr:hypothetical protein M405DRAFT_881852 [Rhizopogon salebrosus TDB-379]